MIESHLTNHFSGTPSAPAEFTRYKQGKHLVKWIVPIILIVFSLSIYMAGCGGNDDTDSFEKIMAKKLKLVHGKCTEEEKLDRWLLQQTWFHSEQFSEVAMVFDQVSFTFYKKDESLDNKIEGAFCIKGNDLIVRYYETSFFPNGFDFRSISDWSIKFGKKIKPLGEDIVTVKNLTKRQIWLKFHSSNDEYVFYRKN